MILESIFRGNLSPTDLVYPSDPEYKQLSHQVVDLSDQLYQTLTPPQQELLEQLLLLGRCESLVELIGEVNDFMAKLLVLGI